MIRRNWSRRPRSLTKQSYINIGSRSRLAVHYVYAAGPTHGEMSTRDGTKLNENEYERKRENGRNNKHTYIPKRVNFKDT